MPTKTGEGAARPQDFVIWSTDPLTGAPIWFRYVHRGEAQRLRDEEHERMIQPRLRRPVVRNLMGV